MCGIAGIIDFAGAGRLGLDELERMAAALTHRGPDEQGVWLEPEHGRCGLAHRRLAVIDPGGGQQPMVSADGKVAICYNGECYNFHTLREELISQGYVFHTQCDTEVVLQLYRRHGISCVQMLRGMFALAIWDQNQRQLLLARDRLGQKPLYLARTSNRLIFASEPKAILQTDRFARQPNHRALLAYLMWQYVPAPLSAFTGIEQLPPAHLLVLNQDNWQKAPPQRYWSLPAENESPPSPSEASERIRETLHEAVSLRMIADVPLGGFLSGGIDSTVVVGLMSQLTDDPVKACSIGFGNKLYNELPYAQQAAQRHGCAHYTRIVEPDCRRTIHQLVKYYDEPFGDCSALPTFHLCRLAREQVTVALSGDGGDEAFGGYDRYRALNLAQKFNRHALGRWLLSRRWWRHLRSGEYRSRIRRLQRFLAAAALPAPQRYLQWLAIFNPEWIEHAIGDTWREDWDLTRAQHSLDEDFIPPDASPGQVLSQAMRCDLHRYLPGDLNVKVDRASMAFGLEVRSPFLDHRLIELAQSLPGQWHSNRRQGKAILRRACADLVPAPIAARPKAGFGVPVGQWMRQDLRELFCDVVLAPTAINRSYLKRPAIETLLAENDNRQADHGHRLWMLLMLELWHRHYIDPVTPPAPPGLAG